MTSSTIVLTQRIKTKNKIKSLELVLTANDRTRLRGRRKTTCGQEVILMLPREGPLRDGDVLVGEDSNTQVLIKAAIEDLLLVRANSILELIQASYHLGNRHVELELHSKELFLLEDPVLAEMLIKRGLTVEKTKKAFFPEFGAYYQSSNHKH